MNNEQQLEEKSFEIKVDKLFLSIMGEGQVFNQLKLKALSYFGNSGWQLEEGTAKEKENQITFSIKVSGKKGIIKGTKDEAHHENKSLWEKTKEKISSKH